MTETICICGAGTMGSGIAQLCAQSGFNTIQFDVNPDMLSRSKNGIETTLTTLVNKQRITEANRINTLQRLQFTGDIFCCRGDIIIEAIVEQVEEKVSLFHKLATINDQHTIFATNTSSIPVSAIGATLSNPGRLVGMHFFNPATLMKLVEVVKAKESAPAVVEHVRQFAVALGKTPVVCNDSPGFIVNRVARPYYLEAMKLVSAGIADVATVDQVMEASGFKMGPFKLMDLIGMDINFQVSTLVWEALGKPPRLAPSDLQKQLVKDGNLGRKTGKGFYTYNKQ